MKIGVLSDTHIGRCIPRIIGEHRRQAYRHAFTQAVDIFIREGIDYLIHAGDVFEKRSMTPDDSLFVKDELQRLVDSSRDIHGKEVMMFAIRGNHDGTPEGNSLDYIKHPLAKYLKIIGDDILQGKEETHVDKGLCLIGVSYHPYISRKFEDLKLIIKKSFAEKSELKLLVIHSFIKGYHQIPPGVPPHNYLDLRTLDDLKADIIIAGHHHTRCELEDSGRILLSPGATEAVNLSDESTYGVYVVEARKMRFIPIKPLHEIRNIKVSSQETIRSTKWFVDNALEQASAYASNIRSRGVDGILRLVVQGSISEDPYKIEAPLMHELTRLKRDSPKLLHVELVNRIENLRQPVKPMLGKSDEFVSEILKPLGDNAKDAVKIAEDVGMTLDERASQVTGLLTGSDRAVFVSRWIEILDKTEGGT
jgi:exonuclease SbcD